MKIFYLLALYTMQANVLQYKVLHRHIVFQNTGDMTLCLEKKSFGNKMECLLNGGKVMCTYTNISEHS